MTAQPDIVLICADDLGYGDLGIYGSPNIRTPHLDRLSRAGIKLTCAYAEPFCGPARAALMTGCYPARVAEPDNTKSLHPVLHRGEITLGEILRHAGYATAMIGKWDLAGHSNDAFAPELLPGEQGFDMHFGTPTSNDTLRYTVLLRDGAVIEHPVDMASLTRRYVDEALRILEGPDERPRFIYLAPNMPHVQLAASPLFRGASGRGFYGDVVEELDFHVGRLVRAISARRSGRDTVVWFTSDNGPWLRERADGGSAGPFRSGKASVWEGGMRVPGIVWSAQGRFPPRSLTGMTGLIDVLPTIARWAGAKVPGDRTIDGIDLDPYLAGAVPASPRGNYRFYLWTSLFAVRHGDWKLHLPRPADPPWLAPLRPSQHIAPEDAAALSQPALFDLARDPQERVDLAGRCPEVVASLLALAEQARSDTGDHDRTGAGVRFLDPGPKPAAPQRA